MEPVIRGVFGNSPRASRSPMCSRASLIGTAHFGVRHESRISATHSIIADVSDEFARDEVTFNAFKNVIKSGGIVRAQFPATGAASQPRSLSSSSCGRASARALPGLGHVVFEDEGGKIVGKGPIAKFIPDEVQAAIREKAD